VLGFSAKPQDGRTCEALPIHFAANHSDDSCHAGAEQQQARWFRNATGGHADIVEEYFAPHGCFFRNLDFGLSLFLFWFAFSHWHLFWNLVWGIAAALVVVVPFWVRLNRTRMGF
jgi:ABC-type uncharacterized transport system permease subunit